MRGVAAVCFVTVCEGTAASLRLHMGAAVVLTSANSRSHKYCIGIDTTDSEVSHRVKVSCVSRVTSNKSHVTRHTSHITQHTSHITHHTSHITHHEPSSLVIHIFRSCSASNPPPNLKPPSPRCARCSSSTLTTCLPAANLLLLLLLMRSMLKPNAAREKQSRRACWCRSMVAQHLKGNCYNFSSRHKIM